ncbi:MAG: dockerin type I repeat-containing protein, partial [Planctomycetota bacterium]
PIFTGFPLRWEIFNATIWSGWVYIVHVGIIGSADFSIDPELFADVLVSVRESDPFPEVDVCLKPELTLGLHPELRAELYWGLASIGLRFDILLTVGLPQRLHLVNLELEHDHAECFRLRARGQAFARIFGKERRSSWFKLIDEVWPDSCEVVGDHFGCPGFGAAAPIAEAGIAGFEDLPEPEIEPAEFLNPDLAISPSGRREMLVYTRAAREDSLPSVQFAVQNGGRWSKPAAIADHQGDVRDPKVAFLSEGRVVAVWVENRMSPDELLRLGGAATPGNTRLTNLMFKNDEIMFSFWDERSGWSAPARFTDDQIPDGMPKIAAIPGSDAVWVTWVRSDREDFVDSRGNPVLNQTSIYAQQLNSRGPVGNPALVSTDDLFRAADISPEIAVSPSGQAACITWVRDFGGNLLDDEGRQLMCSRFDGRRWSARTVPTGNLQNLLMPNVAMADDETSVIVFTAQNQQDGKGVSAVHGQGNIDNVHSVVVDGDRFNEVFALRRDPPCEHPEGAKGRWPDVQIDANGQGVVVYRSMNPYKNGGGDGEIGLASFQLNGGQIEWSAAREETSDDHRDLEIAFALGRNGEIRTVRNSSGVEGGQFGPFVFQSLTLEPDLAVENFRVSNPHAPPGSSVLGEVTIRNRGLAGIEPTAPNADTVALVLTTIDEGVEAEISRGEVSISLRPDGSLTLPVRLTMPRRSIVARVSVEWISGSESNTSNNHGDVILGVLAPEGSTCTVANVPGSAGVALNWENADVYTRVLVYRDGCAIASLSGDTTNFLDVDVAPGEHGYQVVGRVNTAVSMHSEECLIDLPAPPPTETTEPVFLRGDANGDRRLDLSDGVFVLGHLFLGGTEPSCRKAADVNDDANVDISDALYVLNFLFLGGAPVPPPSPECGVDPTPDELECASSACP